MPAPAAYSNGGPGHGYWLERGYYQLYGANVSITPDGTVHLARGRWKATIT
jgi:hypothetical protein